MLVKIKFICVWLLLCLLLGMVACGNIQNVTSESTDRTEEPNETETNAEESTDQTVESTDEEEDVTLPTYDDSYTKQISENLSTLYHREGIPTDFSVGDGYEDLIYYGEDRISNQQKLSLLPSGTRIVDEDEFLTKGKNRTSEYGNTYLVDVKDEQLPFDKALHISVTKMPDVPYRFQISLGKNLLSEVATDGAPILLSFWMRAVDCDAAEVGVVIEQNGDGGTYNKLVSEVIRHEDTAWKQIFVPVIYDQKYQSLHIRLGYRIQEFEIGGFCVTEYDPKQVTLAQLPNNVQYEYLLEDAQWREEAWERIREIRMDDMKVVVLDSDGQPISDVLVEANMFEHEFEWGCGISCSSRNNTNTLSKFTSLFNSAVFINDLKWAVHDKKPDAPTQMLEVLKTYGIDRVRGHCLYWDREQKENDTSIPDYLVSLYGDKEALMECINSHITEMMQKYDGTIMEWDVLNEACGNTKVQDMYGRELIAEWYRTARESGADTELYYNETVMTESLFRLLDTMQEMGVDYDGIGIQSHYSSVKSMEELYEFYCRLEQYGKTLKVTEYTFSCADEQLQASFTRDLMILSFSMESMEGFYHWGIRGGDENSYVAYREDWTPRASYDQMIDLIYNKWWTDEEGRTDKDGTFDFRGYYGAYDITVIANGVKKTVSVDLFKGGENTVTVVME
jgi:GH35 family endo-1,4-beta-xylanase